MLHSEALPRCPFSSFERNPVAHPITERTLPPLRSPASPIRSPHRGSQLEFHHAAIHPGVHDDGERPKVYRMRTAILPLDRRSPTRPSASGASSNAYVRVIG